MVIFCLLAVFCMKWREFQNLFEVSAGWLAPQFAPERLAGELSIGKNAVSAQVSCFHHAAKFSSKIGRNAVAVMKMLLRRDELGFRLEHHKVGVEILCNTPLARVASGKPPRTHPCRYREIGEGGS